MKPLAKFPMHAREAIRGVLTDIDDTLTFEGKLPAVAFTAMEDLQQAGLLVIPVTGRPAGWCDHIARMWPVDGVVGENGAFWFRYDPRARKLKKHYVIGAAERAERAKRLDAIAKKILKAVPGSAIASDQPYREADLAIDFREDVPALPMEAVKKIVALMEGEGMTAKASSIHVNGWFGGYDKLSTSRLMMKEEFGIDVEREREHFVFAGDSPNDQPMFAFFPHAVGVANIQEMAGMMKDLPAYVTKSPGSQGFAELAKALLVAR